MCTYLGRKTSADSIFELWLPPPIVRSAVVEVQNNFLGHHHGRGRSFFSANASSLPGKQIPVSNSTEASSFLTLQRNYNAWSTNHSSFQMGIFANWSFILLLLDIRTIQCRPCATNFRCSHLHRCKVHFLFRFTAQLSSSLLPLHLIAIWTERIWWREVEWGDWAEETLLACTTLNRHAWMES